MKTEHLHFQFFQERVDRLACCRLTKKMLENKLNVEIWRRDDGSVYLKHPEVEDDELDAFLFNLRLFQQDNDGISIRAMSHLISPLAIDDNLKQEFESIRTKLNQTLDAPFMPKDFKGVRTRDFIDAMLYGLYAHTSVKQYCMVELWRDKIGRDSLQTCFIAVLEDYLFLIASFSPVIRKIKEALEKAEPGATAQRL